MSGRGEFDSNCNMNLNDSKDREIDLCETIFKRRLT